MYSWDGCYSIAFIILRLSPLITTNIRLQRYVRDAILRAAAVALKRLSLSPSYNVTPQILSLVQNLADINASAHSVRSAYSQLFNIETRLFDLFNRISRHIYSLTNNETNDFSSPIRTTHSFKITTRF